MCSDKCQWQVLAVRCERSLPLEARARRNVLQRDTLVKNWKRKVGSEALVMAGTVLYSDLDVPKVLAFVSRINMRALIRRCNVTVEAALKFAEGVSHS
jgi:hypothetical protein